MATIEEIYDDPDDLPLPAISSRHLAGSGSSGALLEEINDDGDFDMGRIEEQGRGEGDRLSLPLPSRPGGGSSAVSTRPGDDELRPTTSSHPPGSIGPNLLASMGQGGNNPMQGMMSDLLQIQAKEEERMKKLQTQMGSFGMVGSSGKGMGGRMDAETCKRWFTLYPIYFDAKRPARTASTTDTPASGGRRRIARDKAIWWPQSWMVAKGCQVLGLDCLHEMDKTHPSDWNNPGRVKVQIQRDGKWLNPMIKNRTQLYNAIGTQLQQLVPDQSGSKRAPLAPATTTTTTKVGKAGVSSSTTKKHINKRSQPSRTLCPAPPLPIPSMEDRYPLTSPALATGVAVSSVKRDVEQEREAKKKAVAGGGAGGGVMGGIEGGGGGGGGKEGKVPKMKKVVVRKR